MGEAFKRGQPDKYHSNVEPYLDEISRMALNMTEKQIAEELGVAPSSFRSYKHKYPALVDALKKGRRQLVMELKSTLIQKAKGYNYTEKKQVYENGELVREEVYTRAALPDTGSIHLLLKNLDPENWAENPQELKLKQQQLELQKEKIELSEWKPVN